MRIFFLILLAISFSTIAQGVPNNPGPSQEKISQERMLLEKVLFQLQEKIKEKFKSKPGEVCDPNKATKMPQTFN